MSKIKEKLLNNIPATDDSETPLDMHDELLTERDMIWESLLKSEAARDKAKDLVDQQESYINYLMGVLESHKSQLEALEAKWFEAERVCDILDEQLDDSNKRLDELVRKN